MLPFPIIPAALLDVHGLIEPCPEVRDWAHAMFIDSDGPLANPEHEHLQQARVEFLWTNVEYEEKGRRVLGTAQQGQATGKAWQKAQRLEQLHGWFRGEPDFLIILNAVFLSTARPEQICALIEHELMHCSFEKDEWGDAKYNAEGDLRWSIRGHDVEAFVDQMRRYGPVDEAQEQFIEAAKAGPLFPGVKLEGICGSCVR